MDLATTFRDAAPEAWAELIARDGDVAERLERALADAKVAWPDVELAVEVYVAHLARALPADAEGRGSPVEALDALATDDLYLACACAQGDATAVTRFHETYGDAIRAVIGRSLPAAVDDVAQRLVARLLTGETPAIRTYGGRSSLRSWLRVVATRATYEHTHRERRHRADPLSAIADKLDDSANPELARLKSTYRAEFKKGFAAAFAALTARERNLLRYEHLDGLGIAEIAKLHGVHRATITRWRNEARAKLLSGTKRYFRDVVAIAVEDFNSVYRLIESQLDVSLVRLLQQDDEPE